MSIPNSKTIAGRLDLVRDMTNDRLKDSERLALIIAANMIRENPEICQKYIDDKYNK